MAGFLRMALAPCAIAIGLFTSTAAFAQSADSEEVQSYVLTEAGLGKFAQATKELVALDAACKEDEDDDSDSQSIDDMVAKLNALPGAQAAIQSAGLSTREYVVFSWSILQNGLAAWAIGQPGGKLPPGISQANVDFYKKHEAEIAALGGDDRCGEDSGEGDTEE